MSNSAVASKNGVNVSTHYGADLSSQYAPSLLADQLPTSQALFEAEVPVSVRQHDREESHQPLGICVTVGKGGSSGVSKCVSVRLTDPKDPFFLYSMTLLEDDYGRFKEKHELMVDFNGFPRDLVQMLSGIGTGGSNNMVTFVADSKEGGCVLRILERTEFRALEHLSLSMTRQGDVGQKKHLAERFQYYLAAYTRCEHSAKEEAQHYERLLAECRTDVRRLTQERDQLLDRTKNEAATAASSQATALSSLKDLQAEELRQLHKTLEETRASLNRKAESMAAQHEASLKEKESEVSHLRTSLATAESNISALTSQLRVANDKVANLSTELDHHKKDNEALSTFRQTATQRLSDNELAAVSNTERIRHLTENLRSRDDDLKSLREAQGSQDGYAKMLASQLSALQEKVRVTEASLAKAHHILGSNVQALRGAKEKSTALKGQVEANETLIGEKNNLIERLRGDLMNSGDKIEHLQGKVTELKNQLMRSEEQNGELAKNLKASSDAIIHLQRAPLPTRTFSSMGMGMGTSGSSSLNHTTTASGLAGPLGSFSTENLYRQFAEGTKLSASHMHTLGPTGGITANNQLLTGNNSLAAGIAASRPPTATRSPLSTTPNNIASPVSYLPPKSSIGTAMVSEKPSSYFGN